MDAMHANRLYAHVNDRDGQRRERLPYARPRRRKFANDAARGRQTT
jgi:hypothetical protein